jgi:hypothetical protein
MLETWVSMKTADEERAIVKLRNLILAVLPAAIAKDMENESRAWIMTCSQGHEQSIWDAGGIRYKAAGKPVKFAWCPKCHGFRAQTLHYRPHGEIHVLGAHHGQVGFDAATNGLTHAPDAGSTLAPDSQRRFAEAYEASHRRRAGPVVGLVCILLGLIFLTVGLSFGLPNWLAQSSSIRVEGRVESMQFGRRNSARPGGTFGNDATRNGFRSGGRGRVPVVRFEVDGQSYEVVGKIASTPPAYTVGDRVWVRYPPARPEAAWIDSFVEQYLLPLIFGSIGLVVSLIGMITILRGWLRFPPPQKCV